MHTLIAIPALVFLVVILPFRPMLGQTIQAVSQSPKNEPARERTFSCNPLVLDGNPLDYNFFSIISRGTLTVVAGDPVSKEATLIPFRIYLRRNGMIIQKGASDSGRQRYDVDIATLLVLAQPGDELVVDPARKADWLARRIIRVRNLNWLFPGC